MTTPALHTKRITKVGRFLVLTDASTLPRSVITTLVQQDGETVNEVSRYLRGPDLGEAASIQRWIDSQHFGLVEKLESRRAEVVELPCPSCDVSMRVKVPAVDDGSLMVVNCGACGAGFVSDTVSIRAGMVHAAVDAPAAQAPGAGVQGAPTAPVGAQVGAARAGAPAVCFRALEGREQGTVYPMDRPTLTMGRGEVDIVINDLRSSRQHCEFSVRRELDTLGFYVRDLGSTNGTFVNETRITQAVRLVSGDRIRVGTTVLELEAPPDGVEALLRSGLVDSFPAEKSDEEAAPQGFHETKIYLDVIEGEDQDRSYEFSRERVVLGRGDANVVLKDAKVSRRHAEIELIGGYTPILRDLTSANGTYVNGKRVEESVELKDGDRVRVGDTVIKFSILRSL
ncbi:MAG: FHA domain-containing protein [bacterium]